MKRVLALILAVMLSLCLAACQHEDSGHFALTVEDNTSQGEQNGSAKEQNEIVENPNILVVYDPAQQPVAEAAGWIAQELSADLVEIGNDNNLQADQYEFVLLGFSSQDDRLSAAVEDFWNGLILEPVPFIPLFWMNQRIPPLLPVLFPSTLQSLNWSLAH